jgi:hypothetical protein
MQKVVFGHDMVKTKRALVWSTAFLFVLALAGGLMLYFGRQRLIGAVEFLAALALVLFCSTLAFLGVYYLSKHEVREKNRAKGQLRKVENELAGVQTALADALQRMGAVRDQAQQQREAERDAFAAQTSKLDAQIIALRTAKEDKLASELTRIQREHIEAGLRAIPLDPAHVPGIGPVLAETLSAQGIRTAFDVGQEAVQVIPGFGEAKILSLMRWRESEERALRDGQPGQLSPEAAQTIAQEYDRQVLTLQEEKNTAQATHEKAVEEIHAQEAQEVAAATLQETEARQHLATWEAQKQELQGQCQKYAGITFLRFLFAALISDPATWQKRLLAYLLLFLFLASGILNVVILVIALTHRV